MHRVYPTDLAVMMVVVVVGVAGSVLYLAHLFGW